MRMRFLLIAIILIVSAPGVCAGEAGTATGASLEKVPVEEIAGDTDLRIKEGFDYSEYYGVIRSEAEFERFWANVIDIRSGFLKRLFGAPPERPEVDFNRYTVIWFAHRGANASFVRSIGAVRAGDGGRLSVTVTAYHSDFGSDGFDLWKIPRTDGEIVFSVVHEYEERGP